MLFGERLLEQEAPSLVDLEYVPTVRADHFMHVYAPVAFVRICLSIAGTIPFASSVAVR